MCLLQGVGGVHPPTSKTGIALPGAYNAYIRSGCTLLRFVTIGDFAYMTWRSRDFINVNAALSNT